MELVDLLPSTLRQRDVPIDTILAWRRVFKADPAVAAKMLSSSRMFWRLSLVDVVPDKFDRRWSELEPPTTKEEARLLESSKAKLAWGETGIRWGDLGHKCRAESWNDKLELLGVVRDLDQSHIQAIVSQLLYLRAQTEARLRFREHLFVVGMGSQKGDYSEWLSRLSPEAVTGLLTNTNNTDAFKTIMENVTLAQLEGAVFKKKQFQLSAGDEADVRTLLRQSPALGQLALGNFRIKDKGWILKTWVSRYKYCRPKKLGRRRPFADLECFNPIPTDCDVTSLPNKFFTKPRLKAFKMAIDDLPKVTVIASKLVTKKLEAMGLERVREK